MYYMPIIWYLSFSSLTATPFRVYLLMSWGLGMLQAPSPKFGVSQNKGHQGYDGMQNGLWGPCLEPRAAKSCVDDSQTAWRPSG